MKLHSERSVAVWLFAGGQAKCDDAGDGFGICAGVGGALFDGLGTGLASPTTFDALRVRLGKNTFITGKAVIPARVPRVIENVDMYHR